MNGALGQQLVDIAAVHLLDGELCRLAARADLLGQAARGLRRCDQAALYPGGIRQSLQYGVLAVEPKLIGGLDRAGAAVMANAVTAFGGEAVVLIVGLAWRHVAGLICCPNARVSHEPATCGKC